MVVFWTILLVLSCLFLVVVVIDKALFMQKIKSVEIGMTGKEIQELTHLGLRILKIEGNSYSAVLHSYLTIFKLRLVFTNGRLISKQRF